MSKVEAKVVHVRRRRLERCPLREGDPNVLKGNLPQRQSEPDLLTLALDVKVDESQRRRHRSCARWGSGRRRRRRRRRRRVDGPAVDFGKHNPKNSKHSGT
jgi:hypothetical protein